MFHLKEKEERDKALIFLTYYASGIQAYEFTPVGSFSPIDLYFTGKTTTYSAEIKVRTCPLDLYPDYMIQEDKYQALIREHQQGRTALYLNFFTGGPFVVFNISERIRRNPNLNFTLRDLPVNHLKESNKLKSVGYLTIQDYDVVVP